MGSSVGPGVRPEGPRSLYDLLDGSRIVIPLPADSLPVALEALAAGLHPTAAGRLGDDLRRLGPPSLVAMGEQAVLAHLRTEGVEGIALAIGVAERPLAFAPDTAPAARTLVLIASRPANTRGYLQTLGALGRALRSGDVAERIGKAREARDILEIPALREPFLGSDLRVGDVMTTEVVSVAAETPLTEVADLMVLRRLRALPVVNEEGEVLGLVTDRQVMEHFLPRVAGADEADATRGPAPPVREVMVRSVLCVTEDEKLRDVAALMINKDVERFPVCTEGALVGFLTRGDIIRKLLGSPVLTRNEAIEGRYR